MLITFLQFYSSAKTGFPFPVNLKHQIDRGLLPFSSLSFSLSAPMTQIRGKYIVRSQVPLLHASNNCIVTLKAENALVLDLTIFLASHFHSLLYDSKELSAAKIFLLFFF
jgi:hypothetical protein